MNELEIIIGSAIVVSLYSSFRLGVFNRLIHRNNLIPKNILKSYGLKIKNGKILLYSYLSTSRLEELKSELSHLGFTWNEEGFFYQNQMGSNEENEKILELETKLNELANYVNFKFSTETKPSDVINTQTSEPRSKIDIEYFKIPRTVEEITKKYGWEKQGLYIKLNSMGIKRNSEQKYYIP